MGLASIVSNLTRKFDRRAFRTMTTIGIIVAAAYLTGCSGGETEPVQNIRGLGAASMTIPGGNPRWQDWCNMAGWDPKKGLGAGWNIQVRYFDTDPEEEFTSGSDMPFNIQTNAPGNLYPLIGIANQGEPGWYSSEDGGAGIPQNCFETTEMMNIGMGFKDDYGDFAVITHGMGHAQGDDDDYDGFFYVDYIWGGVRPDLLPGYGAVNGVITLTTPNSDPVFVATANYQFWKYTLTWDFAMQESNHYEFSLVEQGARMSGFEVSALESKLTPKNLKQINELKKEASEVHQIKKQNKFSLKNIIDILFKKPKKIKSYYKRFLGKNKYVGKGNYESRSMSSLGGGSEPNEILNPGLIAYHITEPNQIPEAGGIRWFYQYERPEGYESGMIDQPRFQHGSRFMIPHKDPNGLVLSEHSIFIFPYAEDETSVYAISEIVVPCWEDISGHFEIPLYDPNSPDPNNPNQIYNPSQSMRLLIGPMQEGDKLGFPEPLNESHDLRHFADFAGFYKNNDPITGKFDARWDYDNDLFIGPGDLPGFVGNWLMNKQNED